MIAPTDSPFLLEEDIDVANPQIEDGHVDIANEIVEALARIRLSGQEMQCLWVILRKTYGWHKKEDLISLSQFSLMTGLPRKTVCKVLKKLSSKMVIAITQNGDSPINLYRFNKDFEKWKPLPKKVIVSPNLVMGVTNMGERVSPKKGHTKENIQKKLLQKKVALSDEEFLISLKEKFTWIDFDQVMIKIDAWLLAHPHRKKTRRFIVNWLNKIEKPMEVKDGKDGILEKFRQRVATREREIRETNGNAS